MNLEEIVFATISENLKIPKENIRLDSKIEELSKDSIELFNLIIAFEDKFKTQVDYEELVEINTVSDIVNYIDKKNQNG